MATNNETILSSSQLDLESDDGMEIPINVNDAEIFQKDINTLTVADVYNIASSVGREFEKLTDAFGGAIFSDVMPKMIRVLEMLEAFAAKSQNISTDVVELQDLDMVETAWREETRQLLQSVETLQEDNKKLTQLLTEKLEAPVDSQNNSDQQVSVLSMLEESVEKKRDEIREKNLQIEQQSAECEALSSQAQQLSKLNVNLRRKVAVMEQQASILASQNTDLETICKEKDRQIKELQKRLSDSPRVLEPINEEVFSESVACEASELPIDPLLANKLVIDLSDPDRPRYTLHELKEVLEEKNKFKLENFILKDEVKSYRQLLTVRKEESWEEIDPQELSCIPSQHEVNNNQNMKSEGGIRKLFTSIFLRGDKNEKISSDKKKQKASHVRFDLPVYGFDDCEDVRSNDD
uniref:RILP-like protein 1 isoform X3 n=1 Tax=Styela clava TaxID=7725 RepID=UPI0019396094|nr:RILP-like protein 1 isoform X3 [Styela clava]